MKYENELLIEKLNQLLGSENSIVISQNKKPLYRIERIQEQEPEEIIMASNEEALEIFDWVLEEYGEAFKELAK